MKNINIQTKQRTISKFKTHHNFQRTNQLFSSMSSKTSGLNRQEKLPHAYDFQVLETQALQCTQNSIVSVLSNVTYSAAQAQKQVDTINRTVLSKLNELSGNFKWIVTTLICQMGETGTNGLQLDNSALWDLNTDGCFVCEWKNASLQATVCVVGLAL